MEENISNYQGINWINTKNNRIGHSITVTVGTMAFFIVTGAPLVNNSAKFINTTSPKQQIIKNFRRKSDVNMSNNKNTPAQEVRQKDLDDLEKIVNGHFETLHVDIERIEQNDKIHFTTLKDEINDLKTSISNVNNDLKTSVSNVNNDLKTYIGKTFDTANNRKIANSSSKTQILAAKIGVAGAVIGAVIGAVVGAVVAAILAHFWH